jgi:hypothetical protein
MTTDKAPERIWIDPEYIDSPRTAPVLACNLGTANPDRKLGTDVEYTRTALAPDPLGAVKVKPLVWGYHPVGLIAGAASGTAYLIDTRNARPTVVKGLAFTMQFETIEAAKAAAQAEYETRILSALEPADVMADARVVALVDAVRRMQETVGISWAARDALASITDTGGRKDG